VWLAQRLMWPVLIAAGPQILGVVEPTRSLPGIHSAMVKLPESFVTPSFSALVFFDDRGRHSA
jgi:hypothetical protein